MHYLGIASLVIIIRLALGEIFAFSKYSNTTIEEFRDEPAQFGAPLPMTGIRVEAVKANPPDACSKIAAPPSDLDYTIKWVAIIARNNCTFEQKIRNAQNAGFDAAIVHNIGSEMLEPMSAKNGADIRIPSVFVGETAGIVILSQYTHDKRAYLLLTGDSFNGTNLILSFAIIAGLCFILMLVYMFVRHVRERRRLQRQRFPTQLLNKIPTIKFSKSDPYETCVICLEDYVEGDKLRVLPCFHAYHLSCIDKWLTKRQRVCPICKRKVFAQGERRRRTSSDSMSDNETSDTTPLIPPAGNTSNNHGTFVQRVASASINEARSSTSDGNAQASVAIENETNNERTATNSTNRAQAPLRVNPFDRDPNRVNPFDRVPNLPPSLINSRGDGVGNENSWTRSFRSRCRFWRARNNNTSRRNRSSSPPDSRVRVSAPTSSANAMTTDSQSNSVNVDCPQPASNNILNTNLSGSFKNDEENDLSRPSSASQEPQTRTTSSQGRLGVAAIPNTNFNPTAFPDRHSNRNRSNFFV